MRLLWFSPSVYVKAKRVEGSAQELVAWDTKGPRWTKAVQSCIDAFERRVSPQEVREAFEAAAKKATVYLSPE
ncbi:MAG: DUF982 domain-containing protein [Mesorhizobium sp.]|uniref:DUF982 domain-containing protein n=1 Tax=Mesorhizobium sp. TaxID=1871066 RepID=UPI00120C9169|nr:DUF982 domain-containing protein [Mesorhizobium sp.]TIL70761.1 MAG: DUF982 domain-containing protein [Mesorhizobium sp.]TIL85518.1 MAG: DUF982 domain-containing protein [Mesorhizobium sp.]TIL97590.1 MAG: DUF982 domain-containing protein [Mesorhizobium sp.]TIM36430.1 MAG: DUF982 domain-containing protein [Mesorhizobium sp.]TIM80240.1 MAG: DUF982 domain-containing protein [Mesorhizobium sp.]